MCREQATGRALARWRRTSYRPWMWRFEKIQCFPFYLYDKDGSNRRENITDWALNEFRTHYSDPNITKWDIFHYVYAVLHHPEYRERYAANLKRELPRIPYPPNFRDFATAGERLAESACQLRTADRISSGARRKGTTELARGEDAPQQRQDHARL